MESNDTGAADTVHPLSQNVYCERVTESKATLSSYRTEG